MLTFITFGLFGNHNHIDEASNPMKERQSGGIKISHLNWYKNPRGFMDEMEGRRRQRLIDNQGLKFHEVNGLKILALNMKNAVRKYHLYYE